MSNRVLTAAAAAAALAAFSLIGVSAIPAATAAEETVRIEAPSGEYALDKNHASLVVRASHLGLSHYTLRLTGLDATLNFDAENPARSSVRAVIDANSVRTEFPGAMNFDGELAGPNWLNAAAHPQIIFASTGVTLTGPNTGRMTGDLTLRGVTRPVTLDVTFNRGFARHPFGPSLALLGFSARGNIRRSEFGVNALLPAQPGGLGVGDEVEIIIETEFTRPVAAANSAH